MSNREPDNLRHIPCALEGRIQSFSACLGQDLDRPLGWPRQSGFRVEGFRV